ncbi:hypothetical protein RND81_03G228600 [Saponaria officinalis]|uniref:Bifunctional inhibitor/plant lipid transfer protein/seed storage helical domain-containing protein n=1 Tax=Saponaria officinalis TaxID=3572 RepID=A0AAW1MBN1_SAPOF
MEGNTLITKMGVTILIIICLSGNYGVINGLTPAQCHEERMMLVSACKPVIARMPPSAECCQRIRAIDIQCVCSDITPKTAPLVTGNLDYALGVVQRCGRQIPRHFKCGSITTP